jgi:hypothetical protein
MLFQTSIEPAEFWDQALRRPDRARYWYESRSANSRRRGSRRKLITVGVLPSVQNTVLPPPPRTGDVSGPDGGLGGGAGGAVGQGHLSGSARLSCKVCVPDTVNVPFPPVTVRSSSASCRPSLWWR